MPMNNKHVRYLCLLLHEICSFLLIKTNSKPDRTHAPASWCAKHHPKHQQIPRNYFQYHSPFPLMMSFCLSSCIAVNMLWNTGSAQWLGSPLSFHEQETADTNRARLSYLSLFLCSLLCVGNWTTHGMVKDLRRKRVADGEESWWKSFPLMQTEEWNKTQANIFVSHLSGESQQFKRMHLEWI